MSSRDEQQALDALLWASRLLYAARLDPDGTVRAANPALADAAGEQLDGGSIATVAAAPQRLVLLRHVAAATAEWSTLTIGFWRDETAAAEDRLVHVRASEDGGVLLVAEPHGADRDQLVEQ